eukprot:GHUV01014893.1.p1 GENE.GHUV01014893.1~~GHUV01014893.1.p1  ORF type:complete len:524 (+),score=214.67 GHUV01014893.1:625-2196(+)
MTKFKRQLVPGTYLTAADMLQVLSQQQLTAAVADGCVMLAAQPALVWLLDSCCVGSLAGETSIPISSSGHGTQLSTSSHTAVEAAPSVATASDAAHVSKASAGGNPATAAAGMGSTDDSVYSRAVHLAATAGINRAPEQLQQQYQKHQQQVLNRKQGRARRAAGAAAAAGGIAVPAVTAATPPAAIAGMVPPPAAAGTAVAAAAPPPGLEGGTAYAGNAVAHAEEVLGGATAPAVAGDAEAAEGLALAPGQPRQMSVDQQLCHTDWEPVHLLQLDLPEAFFLVHVLRCCKIYVASAPVAAGSQLPDCNAVAPQGRGSHVQHQHQCELQHPQQQLQAGQQPQGVVQELPEQEFWQWCCAAASDQLAFVSQYAAYHHFRSKGWLPRSGLLYGADYVLYQLHPEHAHSDFVVSVLVERRNAETETPADAQQEIGGSQAKQADSTADRIEQGMLQQLSSNGIRSGMSWLDAPILQRLARQVLKHLLLLYVVVPPNLQLTDPGCIQQMAVREVLVKRWVPAEHRDDGN